MKVVAFNGSPRKGGNTELLIRKVLEVLEQEGTETELIQIGTMDLRGCRACYACRDNQDHRCIIDEDPLNDLLQKMIEADGIIIGSPTYFANVTSNVKALIDRAGLVSRVNGNLLRRKVGAAVVAVRRAGATNAFDAINKLFYISGMIIPGSIYWNLGIGNKPGTASEDEEGMRTMQELGENFGWCLKKIVQRG